jgi:DNA-directed RNA polymerase specialized sigma24 family protein
METLDVLIQRCVAGDVDAWQELVASVGPQVQQIAGAHASLRTRALTAPEAIADVMTATLSRLAKDDYRNLARYLAQRSLAKPQSFDSWLYGAVDFAIREYLRDKFGRAPAAVSEQRARPSKRDLNTQAERVEEERLHVSLGSALAITDRLELAKIVAYMTKRFKPLELQAMRLHYAQDLSPAELAAALGLADAEAASKLVRRLNARLRHYFGERAKGLE